MGHGSDGSDGSDGSLVSCDPLLALQVGLHIHNSQEKIHRRHVQVSLRVDGQQKLLAG